MLRSTPVVRGVAAAPGSPSRSTDWRASSWPCPWASSRLDRGGRRSRRRPRDGGRQSALRLRAELPDLRGPRFVRRCGGLRPHRRPDRAGRHHHARRARAGDGHLSGHVLFAVGIGPFPGGVLAERFGLATPFLVYAIMGSLAARGWLCVPRRERPPARSPTARPRCPAPPFSVCSASSSAGSDSSGEPGQLRERLHADRRSLQRDPVLGRTVHLSPDRIVRARARQRRWLRVRVPAGVLVIAMAASRSSCRLRS